MCTLYFILCGVKFKPTTIAVMNTPIANHGFSHYATKSPAEVTTRYENHINLILIR